MTPLPGAPPDSAPDVDAAIVRATSEPDAARRQEILHDLQRRLIATMPMVRYASSNTSSTFWHGKQVPGAENYGLVTGTGGRDTLFNYKNVWLDKA